MGLQATDTEAQQDQGAPPRLFSFVDLAFLLLIAMTQLAGDCEAVEIGALDHLVSRNLQLMHPEAGVRMLAP